MAVLMMAAPAVSQSFGADRDVTADLQTPLRDMRFTPLPPDMRFRLHEIFCNIRNASITEASLIVTVLP